MEVWKGDNYLDKHPPNLSHYKPEESKETESYEDYEEFIGRFHLLFLNY